MILSTILQQYQIKRNISVTQGKGLTGEVGRTTDWFLYNLSAYGAICMWIKLIN